MDLLPNEIVLQIASYLDRTHLAALMRTSRRHSVCLQDKLYDLALIYVMPYHISVLRWAAWDIPNRGKTFRALIGKGADIHIRVQGSTLLHVISVAGDTDGFGLIVKSGLHPGAEDDYGVVPLVSAARSGRVEMVKYILCEAFDVWKLHAAEHATTAEAGDSQNIPQDIDLRSLHQALYVAAEGGHASVVKFLCQHVDVSQPCLLQYSFTESAAKGGSVEVLQTLIKEGARSSPRLLRIAACNGHRDLVDEILSWQTDIPARGDDSGHTPLREAAIGGHAYIVEILLRHGANPNTKIDISARDDDSGYTPLHEAAVRGDAAVVEILLRHGANPNTKTEKGATAWDLADMECHEDVMDILERGGADIAMPDPDWWDDDDYSDGERWRDDNAGEMTMLERCLPHFTTRRSLQEQLQWEFIFAPFSLCKVQNSHFWQSH